MSRLVLMLMAAIIAVVFFVAGTTVAHAAQTGGGGGGGQPPPPSPPASQLGQVHGGSAQAAIQGTVYQFEMLAQRIREAGAGGEFGLVVRPSSIVIC